MKVRRQPVTISICYACLNESHFVLVFHRQNDLWPMNFCGLFVFETKGVKIAETRMKERSVGANEVQIINDFKACTCIANCSVFVRTYNDIEAKHHV